MLHHFGIESCCERGSNNVKVNEYGSNGLNIETDCRDGRSISRYNEDYGDIVVLPACKGDNHRDWDRDGICVKDRSWLDDKIYDLRSRKGYD